MATESQLGRPFWVFWSALTATNIGDGIRLVALPLLATQLTQNPTLIALVTVFTYLPALMFGQIAGVVVDRVRKRRLIAGSQIVRAAVLTWVAFAIALGNLDISMLCAAAFLYGVAEAVSDPAAHAMLPGLVPAAGLSRANSDLQSGQIVGEMFVGRALGGILFAVAQPLPVVANVLLLAVAAVGMLSLGERESETHSDQAAHAGEHPLHRAAERTDYRGGDRAAGSIRKFVRELADGIRVVTHSRLLGAMSLLLAVWAGVSGAFWGVAAIYALRNLDSGEIGFGIMLALSAVGSLAGARLAVRVIRTLGAPSAALTAVLVSSASIIALTWTRELWLASVLLAFNGAAVTLWNVMTITIRQATVEPRLLGRVSSTYLVLARLALPIGAGLAGLIAAAAGAPAVFLVFGGFLLAVSAVLLPMLWKVFGQVWPRGQASAMHSARWPSQ
ncbi:MFS transporter [Salinibacterium sp. NK8237]|uniref:MFS transporter n=1 Tax=Salinibacterium sp. NK8237 TaxID=2792038 RepID=UPI0018CF5888|nr:MFS transporter [Salinibacterium sp. NK8237]MBH0128806.1 MFS transporter [Salinibacterium sp. NK8237]